MKTTPTTTAVTCSRSRYWISSIRHNAAEILTFLTLSNVVQFSYKTACCGTPIRTHKVDNIVNMLVIEYLIQFPLIHRGPPKLNIVMWIFCSDNSIPRIHKRIKFIFTERSKRKSILALHINYSHTS